MNYYVEIMSTLGNEEDNHQKYLLEVTADNDADAVSKARMDFLEESPDLPIHWAKAYKCRT